MSTDTKLQRNVLAELSWEPSVTSAHLGVAANAGVVTLTFTVHVASFAEKHAAELAARRVKGVEAVVTEIEVSLPPETERSDEDLAAAAIDRLAWDVSVPRGAIQVTVERGWITLTGEVDRHYQREAAEQDVRRLIGVRGLSNQTTIIKPPADAETIGADIMQALHRSWFDPKTITVSADKGRVRLTGTAPSSHARRVAVATAWAAPGTTTVVNEITLV